MAVDEPNQHRAGGEREPWREHATANDLERLTEPRQSDLGRIEIPEITLPKGGGALKGIDDSFRVNGSTGTATLSLRWPLTATPRGHGPVLSLTYSSGTRNGPFDLDWLLKRGGIRRRTDRAIPGYLSGLEEDEFQLSGSDDPVPMLAETAPSDWQAVKVTAGGIFVRRYRPRVEGVFARVECSLHPTRGHDPAARIADPRDARRIAEWLPNFSSDDAGKPPVAARAKGMVLPEEVFGLDAEAAGASEAERQRQLTLHGENVQPFD